MKTPFVPIHKHLMLKLTSLRPVQDPEIAKQFLIELVKKVNMSPVTVPQAVMVSDLGNEGLTGSLNLATSHTAFHCWDTTGLLMVDLYSCKDFDTETVISVIDSYWTIDSNNILAYTVDRANEKVYNRYIPQEHTGHDI